ncbi:diguanylate cyclase [Rehaibacterium terrae]|uniref:diguanylate cyclase n=1 Tax=Rehaibacterium terrae TaxID=1341696 RepID=A0A7W7XZM8_9GAMM|nr:diguanylate cyclase (GGDEF)-like protein [Rehaibacterium terrae]
MTPSPPRTDRARADARGRGVGLRLWLGLSYGALTVVLAVALALLIDHRAAQQLRQEVGARQAAHARHLAARFDAGLSARIEELQLLAILPALRDPSLNRETAQALLDRLRHNVPDYAWLGFADAGGRVLLAAGGPFEGDDVSGLDWFLAARDGLYLGKVRDRPAPTGPPDARAGAPERFLDIAMPVHGSDGRLLGVLAAYLSWDWAERQHAELNRTVAGQDPAEVILTDSEGRVLLGPEPLLGRQLDSEGMRTLTRAGSGHLDEVWPGGGRYLTGYARSAHLGWGVLVRIPHSHAVSGVTALRIEILRAALALILLSVLAAIAMARRIGAPLHALAEAAARLRAHESGARLPPASGYREARQLTEALSGLVDDLTARERELRELAESLEQRVELRTRELSLANAELERLTITDPLTGLSNRRHFDEQYALEVERARRQRRPLALMLIDIDHFKQINDQLGHPVGDHVLCTVAQLLDQAIRPNDLIARVGGEEFAVVAMDIGPEHATELAERLRAKIEACSPIDIGRGQVEVSISVGVSVLLPGPLSGDTVERIAGTLYAQADMALYRAKRAGRNRVMFAQE